MGDPSIHVVTTDVEGVKAASSNVSVTGGTEVIRRDIEHTRAEMSETIDAIQRKLDPEVLKEQAKERLSVAGERVKERVKTEVREHIADAKHAVHDATVGKVQHMVHRAGYEAREARTTIVDTIRENPIPAAMVAGGLAWLLMGGRRVQQSRHDYQPRYLATDDYNVYGEYEFGTAEPTREGRFDRVGHRVHDAASTAKHAATAAAHDVRDGASELAHRTREEAHELRIRAQSGARRAERGLERTFRENPIGVGLAALAIGSLVGAALPRTRREDELLGGARDRLMSKARHVAEDAVEKVKESADEKLGSFQHGDRASFS